MLRIMGRSAMLAFSLVLSACTDEPYLPYSTGFINSGTPVGSVINKFGHPKKIENLGNLQVYQWCYTGNSSDDYLAVLTDGVRIIEKIEYKNRRFGFCSSYYKSANELYFTALGARAYAGAPGRTSPPVGPAITTQSAPAQSPSATVASTPSVAARTPGASQLLNLSFRGHGLRPDDIAVIIGNADYGRFSKDIPSVPPAQNDAAAMRRYATEALGIREGNVIFLQNATLAQMTEVFGNERDHRGKLANWVKAGRSRVFVYFSGHGVPSSNDGQPMLVPVDASAARIDLSSYSLNTLYSNLGKLPAQEITLVVEACFSGLSQAGSIIPSASPVFVRSSQAAVPPNLTVMSAGASDQIASWEYDQSHGIFTKHFLLAYSGEADKAPHGNGDGRVTLDEVESYLRENVAYTARRHWGREQQVQIVRSRR